MMSVQIYAKKRMISFAAEFKNYDRYNYYQAIS